MESCLDGIQRLWHSACNHFYIQFPNQIFLVIFFEQHPIQNKCSFRWEISSEKKNSRLNGKLNMLGKLFNSSPIELLQSELKSSACNLLLPQVLHRVPRFNFSSNAIYFSTATRLSTKQWCMPIAKIILIMCKANKAVLTRQTKTKFCCYAKSFSLKFRFHPESAARAQQQSSRQQL